MKSLVVLTIVFFVCALAQTPETEEPFEDADMNMYELREGDILVPKVSLINCGAVII